MAHPSVCQVVLDALTETSTREIFGVPGDAINGLTEAIRRQDAVRFIQVRHEEAGAFAASAQAKLTGRLAACCGTAGPGALHLVNGLYDAKMDHAPVLAITGQVQRPFLGTDYHQEIDLESVLRDVAVFSHRIMTPEQAPRLIARACEEAIAKRGVAHISIPADLAGASVPNADRRPPAQHHRSRSLPPDEDLKHAAELLNDAEKIVILAGIGCRDAVDDVIATAETLGAPIIRTLRAKDVLPDDHALSLGGLGLLGTSPATEAMRACDALLMIGTDFPYEDFYPHGTPAVQIDVVPSRIGRRYPVTVGLAGHAAPTLQALAAHLEAKTETGFLDSARRDMAAWRKDAARRERSRETPLRPQAVAHAIGAAARDDAVFVCDTGAVTIWAARHLPMREGQRFTLSSSLASMGYGLPGAIGAQLAYPERQVIAICGDGGFAMLMADFLTAVKYRLPITVVIFNNGKLGLIQMEQEAQGYPEYETGLLNPSFAKFAELCGGAGFAIEAPDTLAPTLERALADDRPAVVDVTVNPDEVAMPPDITLSQAAHYGLAKVKEALRS